MHLATHNKTLPPLEGSGALPALHFAAVLLCPGAGPGL